MASLMNTINHLRRKLTNSIQTLSENRGSFYEVRTAVTSKLDTDIPRN